MNWPEPIFTAISPPGTALEWLAFELAGEVDHDAVAGLDLGVLAFCRIGSVLLGDALHALVDFGVGDFRDEPLDLDGAEIAERNRRKNFERERVGEIGVAGDDAVDFGFLVRDRDLGLACQPQAPLLDDFGVEFADDGLDGLRHHRAAIDLAQVRDRHLAGPEAA